MKLPSKDYPKHLALTLLERSLRFWVSEELEQGDSIFWLVACLVLVAGVFVALLVEVQRIL